MRVLIDITCQIAIMNKTILIIIIFPVLTENLIYSTTNLPIVEIVVFYVTFTIMSHYVEVFNTNVSRGYFGRISICKSAIENNRSGNTAEGPC